jgi:hypothetical protein
VTFGLAVHPANAGLNIMSPLSYSYFRKGCPGRYSGNVGLCMFPFAKAFVTGFRDGTMRPRPGFGDPERE